MEMNDWTMTVLIAGLGIAVLMDIATHRIPNWLTLGIAIACLGLQIGYGQWNGLMFATAGLLVGLLCFLPFHLFGAMGAGDVKLLAAVGTALGPGTVFFAALLTIIAGGVIALVHIGVRRGIGAMIRRYGCMVRHLAQGEPMYLPPKDDEPAALRFPYALAIACGTFMSLWYVSLQH